VQGDLGGSNNAGSAGVPTVSTLGRVLIILNLLAAGAFIYVGLMDRKIREDAAFRVFLHEFAIAGLPLEDGKAVVDADHVAIDFQYSNSQAIDQLNRRSFSQLFIPVRGGQELDEAAGKEPITSLLAEVKRTQNRVNEVLDSIEAVPVRIDKLYAYLINQAKTFEERERIRAMRTNPKAYDLLRDELTRRFDTAQSPLSTDADLDADGNKLTHRTRSERREEIGHLLYHLSSEKEWRDRVLVVLGQQTYVSVLTSQAANLELMATRIRTLISDDASKFEPRYQELAQKALFLALDVRARVVALKSQQQLAADHLALQESREAEVDAIRMELGKARQITKDGLADQAKLEARLFQVQQEIGAALDELVALEINVRKREVGSGR